MSEEPPTDKRPRIALVLGDQLSRSIAALREARKARDIVLLAEVREEATYVPHHKKKIAFLFAAMRRFAAELSADGWTVDYVQYDDARNAGSLAGEAERALARHGAAGVLVTEPGEWRLWADMQGWADRLGVPVRILEDDRFLCSRADFAAWAEGRKLLRMEDFYRHMRRHTGFLMDREGQPEGGRWNFDKENRRALPAAADPPSPRFFDPDAETEAVLDLVERCFPDHPGALRPFRFAVTRTQALRAMGDFMARSLPSFGDYQDAMRMDTPFVYHSVLSPYLNAGLLDPRELVAAAVAECRAGRAPLNAVEGFVRQIIGWREYVRGLYWLKMPGYAESNALGAARDLPSFYWTGRTDMTCLAQAIGQTLDESYAHHIQRLMITGNFALLAGIDPKQVEDWYLAVYADAYEWVELPNTHGMALFADGGVLGSKPYAAGGNYISKMSDYCRHCRYDVKQRTGGDACPFNALYWDFLMRNEKTLRPNRRLAMPYATLARMKTADREAIREQAEAFLSGMDES